jgi:hypothetical protein
MREVTAQPLGSANAPNLVISCLKHSSCLLFAPEEIRLNNTTIPTTTAIATQYFLFRASLVVPSIFIWVGCAGETSQSISIPQFEQYLCPFFKSELHSLHATSSASWMSGSAFKNSDLLTWANCPFPQLGHR